MSWLITPQTKVPVDPVFNNVSLLLHGNQSGGQFVDSSLSPKTITKVGDVAPGSPGGGTPIYPSNNSAFGSAIAFDGTGDRLTIPSISIATAEDFTLETFLYKTARDDSGYSNIFANSGSVQIGYDLTTNGSVFMYIAAGFAVGATGTAVPTNSWSHVAYTRQGSTYRVFVDGVLQGTGTGTSAFSFDTLGSTNGGNQDVNGYIDDLRITKGVARYTSNFTPPTAPFPDI